MIKTIFQIIIIFLAIPSGIFLSKICSDELHSWKNRLKIIAIFSTILLAGIFLIDFNYKIPIIVSLSFLIILTSTILYRITETFK